MIGFIKLKLKPNLIRDRFALETPLHWNNMAYHRLWTMSGVKYLKKTNHVKRITENEKLIANHIEKMAPIPVKRTSPTIDMNKTLQASPSAKKIGSVSKERDNM